MSWNLLIYRQDEAKEMLPLGTLSAVSAVMNAAFPNLSWVSPTECALQVNRGFSVSWELQGEEVKNGFTSGGYDYLREFAALCQKEGWRIADAQVGEEVDLKNPYAWYERRKPAEE